MVLGIAFGESPCILCWAQRTSMVLIALLGLFVVRYGPRPRYLGLAVLLGTWGMFMALRHSALHLQRDIGQGFATPIFGVHTYIWSWVIHFVALVVIAVLTMLLKDGEATGEQRDLGPLGRFAAVLFLLVVAGNALQAFASTGAPPHIGQGDPVRFSFNPRHWFRTYEETEGRISLRGSWTVPEPDPASADADPAPGPRAHLPALAISSWLNAGPALGRSGALADLARDPMTGQFLAVTTDHQIYVLDSTLTAALHRVVLDPQYSIDLSPLAGAAFLGDTLGIMATNKSWVLLRAEPRVDEDAEWAHFTATSGGVRELGRGRFATVRARQMYALALAFDPAAQELITVSLPNPRHMHMVVSRFARADLVLSSEFEPRLGPGLALADTSRSTAEYQVTGAAVAGDWLFAISAAYSTLLAIDLVTHQIVAAWAVPGLAHPVGLSARGTQLLVAQADGRVAVIERPGERR